MRLDDRKRQLVASYLIVNGADEDRGITASQIMENIEIKKPTLYRILTEPGFRETRFTRSPKQYWFDASVKIRQQESKQMTDKKPELPPLTPLEFAEKLQSVSHNPMFFDGGPDRLLAIAKHANDFAHNDGELKWTQKHLEDCVLNLQAYGESIVARVEQIINHPKYNTPEWWRIFQ